MLRGDVTKGVNVVSGEKRHEDLDLKPAVNFHRDSYPMADYVYDL